MAYWFFNNLYLLAVLTLGSHVVLICKVPERSRVRTAVRTISVSGLICGIVSLILAQIVDLDNQTRIMSGMASLTLFLLSLTTSLTFQFWRRWKYLRFHGVGARHFELSDPDSFDSAFAAQCVLNGLPVAAILFDPKTLKIEYANSAAVRMYGYEKHDFQTHSIDELFLTIDAPRYLDVAVGGFVAEPIHCRTVRHRTSDGTQIDVRMSIADHAFGSKHLRSVVVRDVTSEESHADELRRSEALHRFLTEHASDMITQHSPTGHYEFVSANCSRLLGYQPHELVGRNPYELFHPDDLRTVFKNHSEMLTHRGPSTIEYRMKRANGEYAWVETASLTIFDASGAPVTIVCVTRDIAARKEEDKRKQLRQEKLYEMQRLESVGFLAGGMAHDFNNLLQVIVGNLGLLMGRIDDDAMSRRVIEQGLSAAEHGAALTQQMLAYSGRGAFVRQPVNLSEAVRAMTPLFTSSLGKRTKLHVDLADDLPLTLADRTQVEQVVMNLVINASEALGDDNGTIHITTHRRTLADAEPIANLMDAIAPLPAGEYAVMDVRDSGPGISDQLRSKIFDPFFSTKSTGRGLGLAAVAGIVRSHLGGIQLCSEESFGTTFRVHFPAMEVTSDCRQQIGPSSNGVSAHNNGIAAHNNTTCDNGILPKRILVVDDEPWVLNVMERILVGGGHHVSVASNGAAAIEIAEHCVSPFEIAVIDLTMPGIDGIHTSAALRQILPELKVVLVSGFTFETVDNRLTDWTNTSFLQKPFNQKQLVAAIARAFETNETADQWSSVHVVPQANSGSG